MIYKAVIIDDEVNAAKSLESIIKMEFEDIQVVAMAHDVQRGIEKIRSEKPHLVFLDIEMPNANAFDLLKKFDKIDFEIVFVTAYNEYAIKAIKFSALDYLLKPVDIDELHEAIKKFKNKINISKEEQINMLVQNYGQPQIEKIAIPETDGVSFVTIKEIVRCESDGNYTRFFMQSGEKLISSKTLGDYEEMLSGQGFFRIHRSHLINTTHIVKFVKSEGGSVIMSDKSEVEISRRKKQEFLEQVIQQKFNF
jgi:two-component system, LytTR family, response regulator